MPTGYKTARDNMNDTSNKVNTHNGHEFVDLGLPSGTLWATCNVGATSPEQAGLYFAFGETTGYTDKKIVKSVGVKERFTSLSKISWENRFKYDAAHVHMGGDWRIPTDFHIRHLRKYTNRVWIWNYKGTGVAGMMFTSKINGNSVFFPASGLANGDDIFGVGEHGDYHVWSLQEYFLPWKLHFNDVGLYMDKILLRHIRYSIRGVWER